MAIYTKAGDGGSTQWPDGRKLRKSDTRLEAIGCLDELNAHLGSCIQAVGATEAGATQREIADAIAPVQAELLAFGAILAGAKSAGGHLQRLEQSAVTRMEGQIDSAWAKAGELKHFIIPGGCELACRLQVARTVCRRTERTVVAVADAGVEIPPSALRYLNRLSDLLFALARLANRNAGLPEATWQG